jgi:hypothetical protein
MPACTMSSGVVETVIGYVLKITLCKMWRPDPDPLTLCSEKRAPLWKFEELSTLRQRLMQRAGRLTQPQRKLVLTMSGDEAVKRDLLLFLEGLEEAD